MDNSKPHDKIGYDATFFDEQATGSLQSAREVVPLIMTLVKPSRVVDIGCGVGAWLAAFREQGVEGITGVDGDFVARDKLLIPSDRFVAHDLSSGTVDVEGPFDLAVSLEVAEHLAPEIGARFVQTLASLAPVVLFSAAVPGQGGTHHVNEQWPSYWHEHFATYGYLGFDVLRRRLWDNPRVGGCYKQNMFLFVSKQRVSTSVAMLDADRYRPDLPTAVVHPDVFRHVTSRQPELRTLIRALPGAVSIALRRRVRRLTS